jgi:Lrp/AsnC family leucine-responsive transcriptional regulator
VAFVSVRFAVHDRATATRFEREILAIPRVLSCHNVSGNADYILQIVARDLDDYGNFMRDELRNLPGVALVESSLSLREVKANGALPLP